MVALIDEAKPHHGRHARAVNVGVHQADFLAVHFQCESQIGGDGRFADAALAASHGD